MFAICITLGAAVARAGVAFPDPPGGWTYQYQGDQLIIGAPGSGFTSLDATWSHDNGSDQWDGSAVGGTFTNAGGFGVANRPGGVSTNVEAGVTFLRLQDTGDPRDFGYAGEPSNRKVYFGHDIGADGGSASQIQDGITLSFRARIPTVAKSTSPIDPLHRDGQGGAGVQPYPVAGDGYVTSDGGKGQFVLHEQVGDVATGGTISFSLTQTNDTGSTSPNPANFAGLTMNEFNGNTVNNNVNFGQGTATNLVALDPTDWHEFWIVLKKDPANVGTHVAYVYVDGNPTPTVFKMTAGAADGSADYPALTFLGMGSTATPQNSALDVDFVAYKLGEHYPGGALDNLPPELSSISPPYGKPFHPAAAGISVDALTQGANQLPANGVTLTMNGVDVSSGLVMSGAPQARTITYSNLQANTVYTGQLIVSDQDGRAATNEFLFDTFVEAQTTVLEGEDYNYGSGQYSNNPPAGAYAGLIGTPGIDYLDASLELLGGYRASDAADTLPTADFARDKFTSSGQVDYQLDVITRGEWWNYTRTYTPGRYHAYLRAATFEEQQVRLDLVTSGATQTNQTRVFLGTFRLADTGNLNSFEYGTLTDLQGNPLALPLDGINTVRLTSLDGRLVAFLESQTFNSSSSLALNYLVLAPATAPTTPAVTATPGAGETGVSPNSAIEATILDGSTPVDANSVVLNVNGVPVGATVARAGSITQMKYTPPLLWAGGSSNVVNLSFNDGTPRSHTWGFTVAVLPRLTPAMKVNNASSNGFVWRVFQNAGNVDTSLARAEAALAGLLAPLDNQADPNALGPASASGEPASPGTGTMTFQIPTMLNVNQVFGFGAGTFTPDDQMPGIPGSRNGIAAEIRAYLQLPAGVNTMVVYSDDGFRTTAGFLNDAPLVLGQADGPHEPGSDTLFRFIVQEAGTYAFRTIYYDGEREASIEWYTVHSDGVSLLINDTANGGVAAFQAGTIPGAPLPTLAIQSLGGGQVTITWGNDGTLQVASNVSGPYQDVIGAVSPFTTTASGTKFYRVRIP